MIIDVLVLIFLVLAIIKGLRRGLIVAVFSIFAFIAGIAAAMKLSVVVADYLKDSVNVSAKWLPFISFAVVFIGVVLLVRWAASLLEATVEMAMMGWANKIGGIILFAILYMFTLSVVLFFVNKVKLISDETIANSVTWPFLQPMGPWVIDGFGKLIPAFKNMFTELGNFFDGLAKQQQVQPEVTP
ncbi:CvpA family protein [Niastella populi]|uniref:Colicin V production protein n=1 Tax=Niastella populi TaxID=550983 RepID=A0A1V9GBD1_9BACT|nr:CvpA family protein [Niastella populi]OQP67981.1 colicin V production protein [Niastella populi]